MSVTHAVGIDLGTTYSSIAHLNEHGEPVSLPNEEGELKTPSVVLVDGNEFVVGTEALRNAVVHPERVIENSKRYIGDPEKKWVIDGKPYTPVDVATLILKKLISAAQQQLGPIEQAVITVPALFSDAQRLATMEAGHRAGLARVEIINEPVAAALCYVLGTEGIWFTELADEQKILIWDLGGGTLDLSLVKYQKNEVSVLVSDGDLNLGGIDWNKKLAERIAAEFNREFKTDLNSDAVSRQFLSLEVEQAKRSLSARPRAAVTAQHAGKHKTYQIPVEQFEKVTQPLVDRAKEITLRMLKNNKLGWAHVDAVVTVGGASRMPMIRRALKTLSGRTLNTSLSPDQSIAHGATYYAGMLLSNDKFARSILSKEAGARLAQVKQQSVNARALGVLVRDPKTNHRIPRYLIPANTPLPAKAEETYGTVIENQPRVRLHVVESATNPNEPPVWLGTCVVDELPSNSPEGSPVAVTIHYDASARVHVTAKDVASGKQASVEIIRQQNVVPQLETRPPQEAKKPPAAPASKTAAAPPTSAPKSAIKPQTPQATRPAAPQAAKPVVAQTAKPAPQPVQPKPAQPKPPATRPVVKPRNVDLESSERPIPLCDRCGEPLGARGECAKCGPLPPRKNVATPQATRPVAKPAGAPRSGTIQTQKVAPGQKPAKPISSPPAKAAAKGGMNDDAVVDILNSPPPTPVTAPKKVPMPPIPPKAVAPAPAAKKPVPKKRDEGEDEFWKGAE